METRNRRFRLRTILLLINLLVLILPLAGIGVLRFYESALIRQTESELIAQGAFISATYQAFYTRLAATRDKRGQTLAPPIDYGLPVEYQAPPRDPDGPWRPRPPQLDLATDTILPVSPEPNAPGSPTEAIAVLIGQELEPILRSAQYYTLAGIRVVDFRGTLVASTFLDETGRSMLDFQEIARALRGEPVSSLRDRGGSSSAPPLASISRGAHVRVFVATPIIHAGRVLGAVLLVRTPANIQQAIYGKRSALISGGLLIFCLVLALSLLTSLTISRPVQALIEQTRRASRGERGAVIPLASPGTHEIGELSDTIALMAVTLETRATYIRDFAAHVSHEFKTPLTAIHGAVELLREHGGSMTDEERGRFLGILRQDAERLEALVRRLLELARADMTQPGHERAPLRSIIDSVAARFRELGLSLEVTTERITGTTEVAMAPEALDAIVANLLDNARQHGGRGVRVTVFASLDLDADRATIDIADDGGGVNAANAPKVFEPFFTTARSRGSTGLGLAILRSLLAGYGGDIALIPSERGARFRVRLPLAVTKVEP